MTEYRIETVSDFLKVPAERRAACLAEFTDWIELAEAMTDLTAACGVESEAFRFEWIDDGKSERTVVVEASPQAEKPESEQ